MPQLRVNCTRNKTSKGVKAKVSSESVRGNTPKSGIRRLLASRGTCYLPPWGTTPADSTALTERACEQCSQVAEDGGPTTALAPTVGAAPQRWEDGESCLTCCVLPLEKLNHWMVAVHICLLWPVGPPSSFFPSISSISKVSNSNLKASGGTVSNF